MSRIWALPNGWSWTNLENLSDVVSKGTTPTSLGVGYVGVGVPFIRAEDVNGGAVTPRAVAFHVDIETHNSILARSQLRSGDLLITIAGTLGRVGFVPNDAPQLNCNQAVAFARLKQSQINPKYACFACQHESVLSNLVSLQRVGTIGNLNLQQIREFQLPVPSLAEQYRIITILDKADRLRTLRRYALELSESYLQAVFLDVFGDPMTNPKDWDVVHLDDNLTFITSGSRGWAEHYSDEGDIFLRIQNVGKNQLLLDDITYVRAPDTAESKRTRVQSGDLLISITADLGRTAVIPKNFPTAYINQHLVLLRLRDLDPVFVAEYFSVPSGRAQILRLDREGVKSGLNFDDIRGLSVFSPPADLQEHFVRVYSKFRRVEAQQREALRQAEHLFQTLLHRAFQGEL